MGVPSTGLHLHLQPPILRHNGQLFTCMLIPEPSVGSPKLRSRGPPPVGVSCVRRCMQMYGGSEVSGLSASRVGLALLLYPARGRRRATNGMLAYAVRWPLPIPCQGVGNWSRCKQVWPLPMRAMHTLNLTATCTTKPARPWPALKLRCPKATVPVTALAPHQKASCTVAHAVK